MLSRRRLLGVAGSALALCGLAQAQDTVAGTWKGTLPKSDLPLIFTFKSDGTGTVNSTKQDFTSPATISVNGKDVTISVPAVQGEFTGTLEDGRMSGTWKQGSGYTDSLELEKE